MNIDKIRRDQCVLQEELIVVIDVIRAFTTAALAFLQGAEKIILVSKVKEAFLLKKKYPHALLMGEEGGIPVKGFHFSNSPVELSKSQINGETLIQRTSSGTQGVVLNKRAGRILTASFANAEATFKRIQALKPQRVTFVITGTTKGGDEDVALADYLEKRLQEGSVDPGPYLERVKNSASGQAFLSGAYAQFPKEDLRFCLDIDSAPFAMEVFAVDNELVLRAVDADGRF